MNVRSTPNGFTKTGQQPSVDSMSLRNVPHRANIKPYWFSQQARHHTLLDQCWSSVCDAGPTLNQQWVNASRLPGIAIVFIGVCTYVTNDERRVENGEQYGAGGH